MAAEIVRVAHLRRDGGTQMRAELNEDALTEGDVLEGSPAQALRTVIEGPRIRVTDGKTKTLTGDDYTLCMMLKTLRCCEMHVKGLSLKKVYDTEEGFRFFKAERSKRGLD